jgi:hypothetical protein
MKWKLINGEHVSACGYCIIRPYNGGLRRWQLFYDSASKGTYRTVANAKKWAETFQMFSGPYPLKIEGWRNCMGFRNRA